MTARDWKPNRRERRILLALMSGLPRLSGYPISRLAQASPGVVYTVLGRLENGGWVLAEWDTKETPNGGRRRFYTLTPFGREYVTKLLGMEG